MIEVMVPAELFFMLCVFVFGFGAIIGSFLNVVICRYNTGESVGGRSHCGSCAKMLHWYELVPIISWLFLRGRCSGCSSRVSIQYPLVELGTGLMFLGIFLKEGLTISTMLLWFIACVLMVIFVYDLKHKIIPDLLSFLFAFAGLILLLVQFNIHIFSVAGLFDLLAGPLFFLPFYVLWKISGGAWIGLGDGKLAIGIGWMLGLSKGVAALMLSFWIGAIVSLLIILVQRLFTARLSEKGTRLTIKSEIPFAPFMILGCILAYAFGIDAMMLVGAIGSLVRI